MTVQTILNEADYLRVNAYTREQKLKWLRRVEEAVTEKIMSSREGAPGYEPLPEDAEDSRELLLPDAFAEVYLYYLLTQMDLYNGELARYNNSAALYNKAFADFADYWSRTHKSKKRRGAAV